MSTLHRNRNYIGRLTNYNCYKDLVGFTENFKLKTQITHNYTRSYGVAVPSGIDTMEIMLHLIR